MPFISIQTYSSTRCFLYLLNARAHSEKEKTHAQSTDRYFAEFSIVGHKDKVVDLKFLQFC